MMKKKYIWLLTVALLCVACDGDEPETEAEVKKGMLEVTPNLTLLADGQEADLSIKANCKWTIRCSDSWLTVNPAQGSNSQIVKVSALKNTTGKDRVATLTVEGVDAPQRTVDVTQPKSPDSTEPEVKLSLATDLSSLSFEASGGSKTFTINSNTNWTISKPNWCSLSNASSSGNSSISVTASENVSTEPRTGQIVITGEGVPTITIAVAQKAKEDNTPIEPGPNDNLPPD